VQVEEIPDNIPPRPPRSPPTLGRVQPQRQWLAVEEPKQVFVGHALNDPYGQQQPQHQRLPNLRFICGPMPWQPPEKHILKVCRRRQQQQCPPEPALQIPLQLGIRRLHPQHPPQQKSEQRNRHQPADQPHHRPQHGLEHEIAENTAKHNRHPCRCTRIAPSANPNPEWQISGNNRKLPIRMIPRRTLLLQLAALTGPVSRATAASLTVPEQCRQLITVIAPAWNATRATLRRWERPDSRTPWAAAAQPIAVVLGRAGLRPGRGLHPAIPGRPAKQEGDGCSPAGLFSLGTAFGTAPKAARPSQWPWLAMTSRHAGVDDPRSRHYNRIVDRRSVQPDWTSAENMIPGSGVYRLGLVVRHNWDQQPGAGSCIFLHIWDHPEATTAGCTAMDAANLASLLQWLQPSATPLLLQLPQALATRLAWLPGAVT